MSCYSRGAFAEAFNSLSTGVRFSERMNFPMLSANAQFIWAESCCETREYQRAESHFRKGIELGDSCRQWPSFSNLGRMALKRVQALSGDKGVELAPLRHYVLGNRIRVCEGWIRRVLGEILLILDDRHFPEAQHWIEQAMEADERNGMRWHLARDIAVYAEVFKRKGDKDKAKDQLGRAIDIYKECGADGWVTRAEEELARLS
jgi:tetratricopeptide (TPR) repeat protein